jgi:DNA-binding NarL/FixJ family response regulator
MSGGTLVVSRAVTNFPHFEKRFKQLGFINLTITDVEKDALNFKINEVKPSLLIMSSDFYHGGTSYMVGKLHETFRKLNIAVVSLHDYPLTRAAWFIFNGAKSYLSMRDKGYDEFHRGLQIVRNGGKYISPTVEKIIEEYREWPNVKSKLCKRQFEILILTCSGLDNDSIGEKMHLCERTVYYMQQVLYNTFNVEKREEMVSLAWGLGLITAKDIKFCEHKRKLGKIPDWADTQIKINRKRKAGNR